MTKRVVERVHGLRFLEPGPTVLVTSMFRSQPNVMTAAWLSPLGFDPPIIGVSVHPGRLTHELISKSEMFGVSVPSLDLLREVHQCGMISGREMDKFEATGLLPVDPHEVEAPRIDQCLAHLECGVVERLTLADHDLFVGEILVAEADDRYFLDRWIADDEIALIHHVAAEYYAGLTRAYAVSVEEEE